MKIIDLYEDEINGLSPIEMALDIAETESSYKWANIVLRNYFKKNPNQIVGFGESRIDKLMKYIDSLRLNFERLSRISVPQAIEQSEKGPSKRSIKKMNMQVPNPKDITENDIQIDKLDDCSYNFSIGPYKFFCKLLGDVNVNLGWHYEHGMKSLFDKAKKLYGGTGVVRYIGLALEIIIKEFLKNHPDIEILQVIGYDEKRGNLYAKFANLDTPGFNSHIVKSRNDGKNLGIEFVNAKNLPTKEQAA